MLPADQEEDRMTAEREPRTEAGKALLDAFAIDTLDSVDEVALVLAIEEQAAAEARRELDVDVLAQAMRAVLDTTTRERVLPYADKLAAEYRRLIKESDRG